MAEDEKQSATAIHLSRTTRNKPLLLFFFRPCWMLQVNATQLPSLLINVWSFEAHFTAIIQGAYVEQISQKCHAVSIFIRI